MTEIVETCPGCETTTVHADDCPTLDPPDKELPCLVLQPHAPHEYTFSTSRLCPGVLTPGHVCPYCGTETTYQAFSGGKEWSCPECEETGPYEEGQAPRRVAMLTTSKGRITLRREMHEHLSSGTTCRATFIYIGEVICCTVERDCHSTWHRGTARGGAALSWNDEAEDAVPHSDPMPEHVANLYFCPTVGEIESAGHSGFDTCCAHPELHVPVGPGTPAIAAISRYLSEQAEARYYNIDGSSTVHTATAHKYLSTACYHGDHDYCQSNTGSNGQKIPARCKFCEARCICSCHRPGTVTVVERIVRPVEDSDDQNAREHKERTQQRTKGVVAVIGRGVIRLPGQRGLG